jgi:hypothetical protein
VKIIFELYIPFGYRCCVCTLTFHSPTLMSLRCVLPLSHVSATPLLDTHTMQHPIALTSNLIHASNFLLQLQTASNKFNVVRHICRNLVLWVTFFLRNMVDNITTVVNEYEERFRRMQVMTNDVCWGQMVLRTMLLLLQPRRWLPFTPWALYVSGEVQGRGRSTSHAIPVSRREKRTPKG